MDHSLRGIGASRLVPRCPATRVPGRNGWADRFSAPNNRIRTGAPIDLLALGLAAWCRRIFDELAAGRKIAGANANTDLETLDVSRARDALAILSIESLFGELGGNARVVESVRSWLDCFRADGVAVTLMRVFG